MLDRNVSLSDRTYKIKNSGNYNMSIQVSLDGLSFCIYEKVKKKVVFLYHTRIENIFNSDDLLKEVQRIYKKEKVLNADFNQVKVSLSSRKVVFIPENQFAEKDLKTYLELSHPIDELDEIHFYQIPEIAAYAIYAVPGYISNLGIQKHKHVKFYNQVLPLIKGGLERFDGKLHNVFFVHVSNMFFDVLFFRNNQLLIYNSFPFQDENDFTYYLISLVKQFDQDPSKVVFMLSGSIDPEDKEIQLLNKFTGNLYVNLPADNLILPKNFNEVNLHYFTSLLNLMNCG
jgi:hypothetical protein